MNIGVLDVIDILVLATVLYQVYRFSHTRRAGRVLTGLVVVILASLVAVLLKLPALSYLIRLFSAALFFCFVLIFQPEIRDALERIGNSRFVNPLSDTLPQKKLPAAKQVVDLSAPKPKKEKPKGGTKDIDKLIRRLEREIEKQEKVIADLDVKIEAAAADYQELSRLLGEKEEAELVLMDLMEQWETAQEN
jgi:hypothetical protein